jgi:hypothetical protein
VLLKKRQFERWKKEKKSLLIIDEKNWRDRNSDRDQINADEKKRFENLEKKHFENLDEDLDDDLENDLESANFMNTKFVNLHVIFSFSI